MVLLRARVLDRRNCGGSILLAIEIGVPGNLGRRELDLVVRVVREGLGARVLDRSAGDETMAGMGDRLHTAIHVVLGVEREIERFVIRVQEAMRRAQRERCREIDDDRCLGGRVSERARELDVVVIDGDDVIRLAIDEPDAIGIGLLRAILPVSLVLVFVEAAEGSPGRFDLLERAEVAREGEIGPHAALQLIIGAFVARFGRVRIQQIAGGNLYEDIAAGIDRLDAQVAGLFTQVDVPACDRVHLGIDHAVGAGIDDEGYSLAVADAARPGLRDQIAPGRIADRERLGLLPREHRHRDLARGNQRDDAALDAAGVGRVQGCVSDRNRAGRGHHDVATRVCEHFVDREVVLSRLLLDVDRPVCRFGIEPAETGVDVVRNVLSVGEDALAEARLGVGDAGHEGNEGRAADSGLRAQFDAAPADVGFIAESFDGLA